MKILSIFFIALFFITSCQVVERESISANMHEQLQKLPQESSIIGYINLAKLKTSPVYDLFKGDVEDEIIQNDEYQEFLEITGFDLEKDLHEIYFAALSLNKKDDQRGIFMASGSFSPDKIIAYIREQDRDEELLSESFNQFTLYSFDKNNLYFCFKDENTIIGGSRDLVIKMLNDETKKIKPNLMPQIESLKYKNWAWMTMSTESFLSRMQDHGISERLPVVNSISNATMAFKLTDNLYFNGECVCADDEKAELLRDAVKGAISAAKLSVSDDRDTIDILNRIDVRAKNNLMIADANMTEADIKKLIAQKNKVLTI
jgi:hypothetical protein